MERHAISRAEKKKTADTNADLASAGTGNSNTNTNTRSNTNTNANNGTGLGLGMGIPEQAGASTAFDDDEAELINRIQGRAAYAVKPKKIAEAAYLNLCHKGSTTRSASRRKKGTLVRVVFFVLCARYVVQHACLFGQNCLSRVERKALVVACFQN